MTATAPTPVVLAWSGGKDSTMALAALRADPRWEVQALMTTINSLHDRVVMHGVRRSLLEAQARSLGLPLTPVELPPEPTNEQYDRRMAVALEDFGRQGVSHVAFGDLYLEDVRKYREAALARGRMTGIFPLWGDPTDRLAERFVAEGYRAILTCVDTTQLDPSFAGRFFDDSLLEDLPEGVDPCGENGEFHSFVFDGPAFAYPVPFRTGALTLREERFLFCDLI